jgi:hypothetical protein
MPPGRCVGKSPLSLSRLLYYALVSKAVGDADAPLPVAECLTNDHGTNLAHFLACFVRDWRKCGSDKPVKVEMDLHGKRARGKVGKE